MIFVYTTCADKKQAEEIAEELIKKHLVVCANLFTIDSIYQWKQAVIKEKETALILKTKEEYFEKIKKEIEKMHTYKIPCISAIKINKINQKYLNWLNKELK